MSKLWTVIGKDDGIDGYAFMCPGCGRAHCFYVRPAEGYNIAPENFPVWGFNGDTDNPTFEGSMLARWNEIICHSFVRDGRIEFLSDCTHHLINQTVELPEVEM